MGQIFAATAKTMSGAFRGTRCGSWGFSGDPQKDRGAVFRIMAEPEGFEPSIRFNPYDDLANRCLQPLGHSSVKGFSSVFKALLQADPSESEIMLIFLYFR